MFAVYWWACVFDLLFCIRNDHDLRLVLLAGLICIAAAMAAVALLRQARDSRLANRPRWLVAAGTTSGFGIWATHFVAMMGYDPGVVIGYQLVPTVLSLLIAIAAMFLGFRLALHRPRPAGRLIASVVAGLGIVFMHYLGMRAMEIPGSFHWSMPHVLASILFAIVPLYPALTLTLDRHDVKGAVAGAMALVLAILLLHFTGMTGLTIVPGADDLSSPLLISPVAMGISVAGAALVVLTIGMMAALMAARARMAIEAQEREFRALVQGITDCALYMLDPGGNVVSWNAGAERLKGFSSGEAIGLNFASFYGDEDRDADLPGVALATARASGRFTAEGWRYRKDGSRFWAAVTIEPVINRHEDFVGFAKITRDMTRAKEDQDRLEALARKLDAAVTNMHQGLVLFDDQERVALVNARFRAMYRLAGDWPVEGLEIGEFMQLSLLSRGGVTVTEERVGNGLQWMRACLAQPGGGGLVTITYEDGTVVDASYRALPEGGIVATFEDVSDRHRTAARIAHMAMHDDLTDLPNRMSFNEHVDREMDRAQAEGLKLAIVAIDFDGFKDINDSHGHGVGDLVLKEIAQRMAGAMRAGEKIARLGGDEFAACCLFRHVSELDAFVGRLSGIFSAPVDVTGLRIQLGASLGVSVFPDDGQQRDQIVGNADLAMYRAKATHGVHACRYEYGMDENARLRRAMAQDLRDALAGDQLSLAFQAQRSVGTGAITGYEALLRWHHPVDGWISPADFIPIAEESGSIVEIGEWVLREACRVAAGWAQPLRVAVNLSPVQLGRADLMAKLAQILMETGLPPGRLELEITETAIIADKVSALHTLRQIKSLGITIAIDDFGTGYSSLETLHAFPFDKIKIDRSFVMQSERREQARAIIRAVIALATSLGMPVLAEGVETDAQLDLLRAEGCTEAQGYLLGRPAFDIVVGDVAA
jgi:diguanylate cyclase (GGDEF)-like protein/PAS domain S-box-containing protein